MTNNVWYVISIMMEIQEKETDKYKHLLFTGFLSSIRDAYGWARNKSIKAQEKGYIVKSYLFHVIDINGEVVLRFCTSGTPEEASIG